MSFITPELEVVTVKESSTASKRALLPDRAPSRAWLLLVGLGVLLCGCTPQPPLRVGVIAWPGYEPLFLAAADGRLPANQFQIVEAPAATDIMRLLHNGKLDAGYLTLDEAMTLMAKGVHLEVILVADRSRGADAVLVRPPRKYLTDLKGSRVGVENSAVGATLLAAALDEAGLAPSDVQLQFIPSNDHERAYREGRVDALVTFEPTRSRLLEIGAQQVFDSSRIPDRILDVMVITEKAKSREGQLRALVAAHFAGLRVLREESRRAAIIIAQRWQIPFDEVAVRFQGLDLLDVADNHRLLGGSAPPLAGLADKIAEQMHAQRLLAEKPPLAQIATASYLPVNP